MDHASAEQTAPRTGTELEGRRILVVGVGGIGAAVVRRLVGRGATVFGTYHSRSGPAEELGASLPEGRWAGAAGLDATDPAAVAAVAGPGGAAERAMGGMDTLVVTTGHRHGLGFFAASDPQQTAEVVATELLGPMNLVRAVLPALQESGFGRIVIVGSDSGKAGTLGDAASSAARAGVAGFVRAMARETARKDITVNVVSPGPTGTEMLAGMLADDGLAGKVMKGTVKAIPKGRTGEPEEIAEAVAYLVGPYAGFTTGQVLSVSGGLTM
ncbi:SDR family NAD(P)-dependent oxidoreductase [Microbacterium sp. A93]|uniref:SDR family NAD(P)-dependent oxidoreductase n=1 Tax=Microbacterium sp. A93 TaxID=3450716 RepID=UPI003F42BDCC